VLLVMYSSRYLAATGFIQGIAAFRIVGRLFGGPENAEFLLARSEVSKLVGIGIIGAIVNVGLDLLLIPSLCATGAVVGSGIGNLAVNLLGAFAVYKSSSERIQWKFWLKIVSVTCATSFVCSIVIPPTNLVLICAQAIIYALLILFFFVLIKPLTGADREWLSRIDSRLAAPLRYFARSDSSILPATPT
ncbi:MAG: Polysacc synt protein, partial [Bacteroidetes bacterium]|nr:Polysacc synt protein [Bacteroidota bacterium]